MITEENFKTIIPDVNWDYAKQYVSLFETVLPRYNISTPLRKAYFLAQVAHESGGFKYAVENLNYSAKALYGVFRKYFPTLEEANSYARQPKKIANKVYANRMGNGNEASNDGWNFRGRGLIQLTGKDNYQALSNQTGQSFISSPELLEQPQWALTSACWFWKKRNINKYADTDDIHMVTKLINGGYNGLTNRQHYLDEFKKLYSV
ncbi:glycoside hydrolase family 19 protein [Aureisphaera sp. CAU 1614]|uniref:Glycoside hydrolase family 19 protein n=1 Tax=Halomarinibacterium sedimenti TaxID=2857106 RepID=A0A9X1JYM6_9FLAO|nr:glycoside hydrolase family 19 protein [Halomarinibacterium sedimenti]MBW2937667.1 glycoside hydrolase family 19 protein [Halomarinibacterium sedimenti]